MVKEKVEVGRVYRISNPDYPKEIIEVKVYGDKYVHNIHKPGLIDLMFPDPGDIEYKSPHTGKIYHIKIRRACDCCITVSYSYPQYAELTRYMREYYLAGKKIYDPLKHGYNSLSRILLKRAENSKFWRIIVKHFVAKPIVKTALDIKNNRISFYIFPFSLLLLVLLLWSLVGRVLPIRR